MNDMTTASSDNSDKYFLEDRELWETLGFDWQGWNSTVARILQQQPPQGPATQD